MTAIRSGSISPQSPTRLAPEQLKQGTEAVWARVSLGLFKIATAHTDPQARSAAQQLATQSAQTPGPMAGQLALGMRLSSLSEEDSLLNPHPLLQEPEKLGMKREADQGAEGESGGMVVEDVDTPEIPELSLVPEVQPLDEQRRVQLDLKAKQLEAIDQQAFPITGTQHDEQLQPWWIALHAYAGRPWPDGLQVRPQPHASHEGFDVSVTEWLNKVLRLSKSQAWLPKNQPWHLVEAHDCTMQSAAARAGIIVSLQAPEVAIEEAPEANLLEAADKQILWGLVRVISETWTLELASLGGKRIIELPPSADPFAWLKHQVQAMLNKPLELWRWAQR